MRIMGLDFGSKTVGVAVSDPLLVTAQGVETIFRKSPAKLRQTLARITQLAAERCEKTKEFGQMLEQRTGLEVILWDERLTTAAAGQVLIDCGVRRENRKEYVDKIAACLILQGYLDSLH